MRQAFILLCVLVLTSQTIDSSRVNTKPSNVPAFKFIEQKDFEFVAFSPGAHYEYLIQRQGKSAICIDGNGTFILDYKDTLVQSCELLDAFAVAIQCASIRTPTQDSAYIYKAEAESCRRWFKKIIPQIH